MSQPVCLNTYCTTTTVLRPFFQDHPGARTELLDFMVQGKINRGRHIDHTAERHSIRTNQCSPPPSSPYFLQAGCPSCRPTNSVKAHHHKTMRSSAVISVVISGIFRHPWSAVQQLISVPTTSITRFLSAVMKKTMQ